MKRKAPNFSSVFSPAKRENSPSSTASAGSRPIPGCASEDRTTPTYDSVRDAWSLGTTFQWRPFLECARRCYVTSRLDVCLDYSPGKHSKGFYLTHVGFHF